MQSSITAPIQRSAYSPPVTTPPFDSNINGFPLLNAYTQPEQIPTMSLDETVNGNMAPENLASATVDFNSPNFWSFSTAWQWAHEGLYLQGGDENFSEGVTGAMSIQPGVGLLPPTPRMTGPVLLPESPLDVIQQQVPGIANDNVAPSLKAIVRAMVDFAADAPMSSDHAASFPQIWQNYSRQLSDLITPANYPRQGDIHLLESLINEYFDNFHPLWPLVPRDSRLQTSIHPLLYLTLTSIGALYAGTNAAASYGSEMHQRLRKILTHRSTRRDTLESHALDVGRAMLLAQVTALYFEQHDGFSAAQRLGATLNAHAHRMRLFTVRRHVDHTTIGCRSLSIVEGRKMLAYGMLRAETFMSVLFNQKPLIASEEINIPLPLDQRFLEMASAHSSCLWPAPAGGLLFSDLVRLMLEPEESLPSLRPVECELLLFGLQHEVWRFSHDHEVFERLTCTSASSSSSTGACRISNTENLHDYLDLTTQRKMGALENDHARVMASLRRWRQLLAKCQLDYSPEQNRATFLSGLVLYELSLLRLSAPLEAIQQTAYQFQDLPTSDEQVIAQIQRWSRSDSAIRALQSAQEIWVMLHQETSRSANRQTKYNILALIALTHAAAVVWALAGLEALTHEFFTSDNGPGHVRLQKSNNKNLMLLFADLYPKITSSWGIQSSFSKVVRNLADFPFPISHQFE